MTLLKLSPDLLGGAGQLKCMATNLASESGRLDIADFKSGMMWYIGGENLSLLDEITGETEKEPTYQGECG